MSVYIKFEQNERVLEPIEYIAQLFINKKWVNLGKPYRKCGDASTRLIKEQRKRGKQSKGRIVLIGVVSTQTYSRHEP